MTRRLMMVEGAGAFPTSIVKDGNLVADGAAVALDTGTGYKAFPGMCRTPAGRLMLVYRHGTEHDTPDDGYIAARFSADAGVTWSSPETIYDPADDVRDPSLTTLSDGRIAMSCFRFASGVAYQSEVLFSDDDGETWGTPVVVTNYYAEEAHTYDEVACSAPVVEISGTDLVLPVYAHDTGANWNAFLAVSDDGGDTFDTLTLIATGGSKSWTEPWIVRLPDATLYCLIRVDNLDETWLTTSDDDGATWDTAASVWSGDGRNATVFTSAGALFTTGRNGGTQGQYGTSWDWGETWETRQNLPSPSTSYQYGAIAQATNRSIVLVWSQQNSNTDADLYLQRFLDHGA